MKKVLALFVALFALQLWIAFTTPTPPDWLFRAIGINFWMIVAVAWRVARRPVSRRDIGKKPSGRGAPALTSNEAVTRKEVALRLAEYLEPEFIKRAASMLAVPCELGTTNFREAMEFLRGSVYTSTEWAAFCKAAGPAWNAVWVIARDGAPDTEYRFPQRAATEEQPLSAP